MADDLGDGNGLLARSFGNLGFGSLMAAGASSARTPLVLTGSRYFFYTPDMNFMAETELTSNPTPAIIYEYIWFGGQPVAQVDSAGVTSWTFTDHLGTPLIQTSSVQGITWRAEYEPYGKVFALRTPDQHQPLRLPGQEAEQFNLGPNGATERSYNIFRWYRSGWGRYTQGDPADSLPRAGRAHLVPARQRGPFVTFTPGLNTFGYAEASPTRLIDPTGENAVAWALPTAASCAIADGPLPIGDIIGVVLLTGAVVYDATRDRTCDKCDRREEKCERQLAEDTARCEGWWKQRRNPNWDYFRACKGAAMQRYAECLRWGAPISPLSPTPYQK